MKSYFTILNRRHILFFLLPLLFWMVPFDWVNSSYTLCVAKNMLGMECPGCGMTRALHQAMHFNFLSAWEFNSFVVLIFPLLVYVWFKKVSHIIVGGIQ